MNGMPDDKLNIVTGAFGFSGKYITRKLLSKGERVRTLTGHPDRPNEFGDALEVRRLSFDNPQAVSYTHLTLPTILLV